MKMLTFCYDYILLVSNSTIFYYVEYSTTVKYSAIFEHLQRSFLRIAFINYFHKKAPSQMLDMF